MADEQTEAERRASPWGPVSERDDSFLLKLSDRLRRLKDPLDILGEAAAALGKHLGVNRAGYAEVEEDGDSFVIKRDWTDGSVKQGTGRRSVKSFGANVVAMLYRGETQRIEDARTDPRVRPQDRAAFEEMSIEAAVTVPLVKDGRLVAMFSLQKSSPRNWTDDEVRLIEEVAERTWAAHERAKTAARLRDSEAAHGFLLRLSDALREEAGTAAILQITAEMLAEQLQLARVTYGEIDEAQTTMTVAHAWGEGVPDAGGVHPLSAFSDEVMAHHFAGRTFVTEDASSDPRMGEAGNAFARSICCGGAITVPLVKGGRMTALLSVQDTQPRRWSDVELRVVKEVAERTWAALERARAETELRQSQALLAAFMENAPVGMYLKDEAGRYVMANAGMDRIFGKPAAEVLGRTADELFDGTIREKIAQQDAVALAEGRAQVAEQNVPDSEDGSWTLIIRFPVDAEAQGRRIGGFAIDVTEQKRAEAELAQSREALYQSEKLTALGSLLAGVSHELNNPLAVVVGQSMMLEEDAEGSPLADRAGKIRRAAERCAKITQTFLAMARQKPPTRDRVDANAVVRAALDLTAYGLRGGGIAVARDLAPDLPAMDADADQLHQVLANLFVNAQQALQEVNGERQVRVATRPGRSPGTIEIEVADNGPGVSPELRRRIFEPFYTSKPQGVGTGLGLSYSLGVVEAHGGRLELVDTSAGAAFLITLPAVGAAARDTTTEQELEASSAASGRALVVDDEPEIAEMISEILGVQGYAVKIAESGADAKAALAAGEFDLILSDLRMPDTDGPALHAWIAAERPHLLGRTGFITGDTMGPNAVRFLARAGRPYLEKPFTPKALRSFVERVRSAEVDA